MNAPVTEVDPNDAAAVAQARRLFERYAAWLEVPLCFQGFDAELAELPGAYRPPRGGLWLAGHGPGAVGVAALRPLTATRAELKRLYVEREARGRGLARALSAAAMTRARNAAFVEVVLETLTDRMPEAVRLYEGLGFEQCEAYDHKPIQSVRYYRLQL